MLRWMRWPRAQASLVFNTASSTRIGNRTVVLRDRSSSNARIQCPRHFLLNPIAGDRVFRQDQQHLVAQPDRLVDGVDDLGADRHVVRREPAAHALVLKVGVEAVGELLVLTRIADEAGEGLPPLTLDRTRQVDEMLQAGKSAEEIMTVMGRPIPSREEIKQRLLDEIAPPSSID
jgi:hypothetical protein